MARHVTLPELEVLTSLFKPRSLSPNTLAPALLGCDYYLMKQVFKNLVIDGGANIKRESLDWFARERNMTEADVESKLQALCSIAEMDFESNSDRDEESVRGLRIPKVKVEDESDRSSDDASLPSSPTAGLDRSRNVGQMRQLIAYLEEEGRSERPQAGPSRPSMGTNGARGKAPAAMASDEDTDEENERLRREAMAEGRSKRKRRRTDSGERGPPAKRPVETVDNDDGVRRWISQQQETVSSPDETRVDSQLGEEARPQNRSQRESSARYGSTNL